MKTKLKIFSFLFFILFSKIAFPLYIGFGCDRAYKSCLDKQTWCSQWPQNYIEVALKEYCSEQRSNCHGTGIRIGFGNADGIIGSTNGGQTLIPYHLMNDAQRSQITSQLQVIINHYLEGIDLTEQELNYIENIEG